MEFVRSRKKLLMRPKPFSDESLFGYIIRLADYNGCKTVNELLSILPDSEGYSSVKKILRIPRLYIKSSNFFYDLAELVQKEPQIIFDLIKLPFEQKKIESSSLLQSHNSAYPDTYKFCALCLKEAPYHRKLWDLAIITACPDHKCLLSYSCPQCDKLLKKAQESIYKCNCEFDIREVEPIFIPESELRLIEYIHFLAGARESKEAMISLDNPLINYPLENFCNIIYYYSKRMFRLYSDERFNYPKLTAQKDLHEIIFKAFTLFDKFPDNYLAYIEELIENPNYGKNTSWFNYFVTNYHDIYRTIPNSLTSLLYKTFNKHIDEILFRNNKKISQQNFTALVSDPELANQLGIEKEEVINLASVGVINAKGQPMKNGVYYLFDGDTFYKIMSKIRSNKKIDSEHKFKEVMNLTQLSDYLSEHGIRLGKFLSFVIQQEIKYCSEDYNQYGLHRFLFQKNDLENFIGTRTYELDKA